MHACYTVRRGMTFSPRLKNVSIYFEQSPAVTVHCATVVECTASALWLE